MTPQRETVTDFAIPLVSDNKAIFMQRPRQETDVASFLKPFAEEVKLWRTVDQLSLFSNSFAEAEVTIAFSSGVAADYTKYDCH